MATASFGISNVSSLVRVLINLAGLPPQSSPDGILLPGGTTEPASRIDRVSTSEPSIRIECCPMMHSGSIVHDLKRLYAPTVTYLSINVCAGNPENSNVGKVISKIRCFIYHIKNQHTLQDVSIENAGRLFDNTELLTRKDGDSSN